MRGLLALDWIALTLMIVGGLNWGLVGIFHFDLVAHLFGATSLFTQVLYILVGLASLYTIGVAHGWRRTPSPLEYEASRVVQTPNGPLACPPCP
jgi:uncharacterized protein